MRTLSQQLFELEENHRPILLEIRSQVFIRALTRWTNEVADCDSTTPALEAAKAIVIACGERLAAR